MSTNMSIPRIFLYVIMLKDMFALEEKCFERYCYIWDEKINEEAYYRSCSSSYWRLEIYDSHVQMEVDKYVRNISRIKGYYVLLGMTCDGKVCRWKNSKEDITYANWGNKQPGDGGFAYFRAGDNHNWQETSNKYGIYVGICMRKNENQNNKSAGRAGISEINASNMLIIGVTLGLACLALISIMLALLVLVVKRKRRAYRSDQNERNAEEIRKESFRNKEIVHLVQSLSVTNSGQPVQNYNELVLPSPKLEKYDPTYANADVVNQFAGASNIVYADLSWSQEAERKEGEHSKDTQDHETVRQQSCDYRNNKPNKVTQGPLGDVYSLPQKPISIVIDNS